MEGVELIEPNALYNLLQQGINYSCLSDRNYLFLIDAREKHDYSEGHIITAKKAPKNASSMFMIPYDAELECKHNIVVYDGKTSSLSQMSPASECAKLLWDTGSRNTVRVLKGGYEEFSARYPFLRTQKIIFTPRELDEITPYPIEIIEGLLYLGNWQQGNAAYVQKDLKIQCHINLCIEAETFFPDPCPQLLHIQEADDQDTDLYSHFQDICDFLDNTFEEEFPTLIFSHSGISRAVTAIIAFLMHHNRWTLAEAYSHVKKCCCSMRPSRTFVKQLSQWEEATLGKKQTDIGDPNY